MAWINFRGFVPQKINSKSPVGATDCRFRPRHSCGAAADSNCLPLHPSRRPCILVWYMAGQKFFSSASLFPFTSCNKAITKKPASPPSEKMRALYSCVNPAFPYLGEAGRNLQAGLLTIGSSYSLRLPPDIENLSITRSGPCPIPMIRGLQLSSPITAAGP